MEFENLLTLIKTVSDSNLTQFSYEDEDVKLKMKTDKETVVTAAYPTMPQAAGFSQALPAAYGQAETAAVEAAAAAGENSGGNVMKSPLVGTFYAAAAPDDEPFAKVGSTVSRGQVLGIVEAMKLMNEIECEFDGVIKEVLVSNGDIVEYGQPMFVIE